MTNGTVFCVKNACPVPAGTKLVLATGIEDYLPRNVPRVEYFSNDPGEMVMPRFSGYRLERAQTP